MANGKTIRLFLMDNDVTGRIKCTLFNWTGVAYKIPRTMFEQSRNMSVLNQTGIYFLFGTDDKDRDYIYVGQAVSRRNGKGIIERILEPHDNKQWEKFEDWTEAIMLTTANDSFGPTEVCYLENRFWKIATDAGRYLIANASTPNDGNPTEEIRADLDEFIEYAKLVTGVLGHKVFEPYSNSQSKSKDQTDDKPDTQTEDKSVTLPDEDAYVLYLDIPRNNVHATGQCVNDGFIVFKDSTINANINDSCPDKAKLLRSQYADKIDSLHKLTTDLYFPSPTSAAGFVSGSSVNGRALWRNAAGKSLNDIDEENRLNLKSEIIDNDNDADGLNEAQDDETQS